jgi:glycosyltransferase involved in cell wall biosynthesis
MPNAARTGCASFVQRMSPSNLLLLKSALLDGDAAIAAYREWRPTLDLATLTYDQQRLLPLLQRNLTRLGISDPEMNRFRGIRRYFWAQNLKAMTFAKPVFAALDRAGVPFIVLKGAALVACYLEDRSLRPMDDIDILVPEERLADAASILEGMNLLPKDMSRRQLMENIRLRSSLPGWPFVGPQGNLDLHWKALHLDRRPQADEVFWQGRRKACLDGMEINVLDPADQLLHIFAHAAQRSSGAALLLWPADASLIVRSEPNLSYERLVSEAARRRLSAIVAEGLSLFADELYLPVPRDAISRLRAAASRVERHEMSLLAGLHTSNVGHSGQLLLEFQDFRRSDRKAFDQPIIATLAAFLKAWTGAAGIGAALIVAGQAMLGTPAWLRRILGRDCYRVVPDVARLPKIGDEVNLGSAIDETALIAGWSIPEPTGRWTVGYEATVAWSVRGCRDDLTLCVDGYALLYEKAPLQLIELCLNDRKIATWHFRLGEASPLPAKIFVPNELLRENDIANFTFLIRSPRSPAEFGVSIDPRPLGLHLRSLALIPANLAAYDSYVGTNAMWRPKGAGLAAGHTTSPARSKPIQNSVVWLDVGDLMSWGGQVTGIQRVGASIAAEFLRVQLADGQVRFCRWTGIGYIPVQPETVQRFLEGLLGIVAKRSLPDRRLERMTRNARAILRRIYVPLSIAIETPPDAPLEAITTRARRHAKRLELLLLRKTLRADKIFRPNDVLLNIGSSWQQSGYPAAVNAIRDKIDFRYVVLIHDVIPWKLPQFFTEEAVDRFVKWAHETILATDKLLVTSNCSRGDVLTLAKSLEVPDKPIAVIRLGEGRSSISDAAPPLALEQSPAGFVLCVGTVEVRKNHDLLVRTWSRLLQRHDPSCIPTLVWAGREGWMIDGLLSELAEKKFLDGKLIWLGRERGVPDGTLGALYRTCLFTMYPSFYEGWGLPVSESLARGKFCLASNSGPIPEIGGDLIDYFPPDDLAKCLELTERAIFDPAYRAGREQRIKREFRSPSWSECCQSLLAACQEEGTNVQALTRQ